jgi:predicted ATP-dependent serine protease
MLRGLRIDCPENIFFSGPEEPFDLADKTDQARLRALIQRQNPEVVIYDPLSCLHQENENDNAKMRRVMGQLTKISRRTATTAIVVHHYGKPGKEEIEGKYRVRGATSIRDWADTVLGYSYHKNEEDLILRNLDFLKIRHGAPLKPLILERDKETFLQRVSDGGTLCSPARVVTILMEKLGGEAEQKDLVMAIQRAVGCQESRARDFLNNAERYGYVVREIDPGDKRKKICRAVWKT